MKLIPAGKLNRTVRLLRRGPDVDDGLQTLPGPWAEAGTRLSWVKVRRAREAIEGEGQTGLQETSFWLRFDDLTRTIGTDWALELDGTHYAIIAPPTEIGFREGIEVVAVAGSSVEPGAEV